VLEAQRIARKQRRQSERRRAILAAARELLLERGIEGFTIAAVASLAEVSKPAVYYYFDSKEELVGALAVDCLNAEVNVLALAIEQAASGVEALDALVRAYVGHYLADLDSFRILNVWTQVLGIKQRLLEREVYPRSALINDALERKLERDRHEGRLHPDVHCRRIANLAWITAHGLVSLASGLHAAGGQTRFPIAELLDEACSVLVRAASAR
jgi:TetR/AcrR family transcriptional regulator